MVNQGDVLFRLDDREIQAQIARDQAPFPDQATRPKRRPTSSAPRSFSARTSLRRCKRSIAANAKVAAANVAADQAALQADRIKLGYTTIKAPIAGRLGVVRVTPGNLVRGNDTGDGLVTITQMKPLRVSFSLPERDLDLVRAALARNGRRAGAGLRQRQRPGARDGQAVLRQLGRRQTLRHDHGEGACSTTRTAGSGPGSMCASRSTSGRARTSRRCPSSPIAAGPGRHLRLSW